MYNRIKMMGVEWMSTKLFTKEEMEMLAVNKYVKHVSAKGITYKDEFRRIFISEYEKGRFPRAIFEECGFVISILGIGRVESISKQWRAKYKKNGVLGLQDTRRGSSGRPNDKELSIEEKYERLKIKNKLLEAENELLKKLDMLERGMRKKK
jgi:transposase